MGEGEEISFEKNREGDVGVVEAGGTEEGEDAALGPFWHSPGYWTGDVP